MEIIEQKIGNNIKQEPVTIKPREVIATTTVETKVSTKSVPESKPLEVTSEAVEAKLNTIRRNLEPKAGKAGHNIYIWWNKVVTPLTLAGDNKAILALPDDPDCSLEVVDKLVDPTGMNTKGAGIDLVVPNTVVFTPTKAQAYKSAGA